MEPKVKQGTLTFGENVKVIHYDYYEKFEASHQMIVMGAKVLFLEKYIDDNGHAIYSYGDKKSKNDEYGHQEVLVQITDGESTKVIPMKLTDVAIKGITAAEVMPMKRWRNITFKPNIDTKVAYNIFNGFPVKYDMKKQVGNITPFMTFLQKTAGKEDGVNILKWFADMYQNPGEKINWAIGIRGEKGIGKNTIVEMLGRGMLHSENYFSTAIPDKLFGKFLGHMSTNLLSVADEMVWGGDHDMDSLIKDFITNPVRAIEAKYRDASMLDNYSRLFMTSNGEWIIGAAGKKERRYLVVELEDGDTDFAALWKWYNNGGKEALFHYLMGIELKGFPKDKAPYSKGLASQKEKSLMSIERYIFEALSDGAFGVRTEGTYTGDIERPKIGEDLNIGATTIYQHYATLHRKEKLTQSSFGRKAKTLMGLIGEMKRVGTLRYWQLPDLKTARKAFTEETGVEFEGNDVEEWEINESILEKKWGEK